MQESIDILSTRGLDSELIGYAEKSGIHIDVSPFIQVEPYDSVELRQELEAVFQREASVVFTSSNAVEAVYEMMDDTLPVWNAYCVGSHTAGLVEKYFPQVHISATADNAEELAAKIIEDAGDGELVFFCGDKRRDELPDLLRQAGLELTEIVVYHTITLPHRIRKNYHGLMFFSPSAVTGFFELNRLPQGTPLFAIGRTTASAIKRYCDNPVYIPDHPSREALMQLVVGFFS